MLISYTIKLSGRFLVLDFSFIIPVVLSNSLLPKIYFLVACPPTKSLYTSGFDCSNDFKFSTRILACILSSCGTPNLLEVVVIILSSIETVSFLAASSGSGFFL